TATGIGAALSLPSDVVGLPLNWKDGHSVHLGGSYKFAMAEGRHLRALFGATYDRGVTRPGKPVPGTGPAGDYYGGSLGAQYNWGSHTAGLAASYGQMSHKTTAVDADVAPGIVFPGNYSLKILLMTADYEFKF